MVESVNFEFLREQHPELADYAGFAERYVWTDPMGSLSKMRTFAEQVVKNVYKINGFHRGAYDTFNELLHNHEFKHSTPRVVLEKLAALKKYGNKAAHGDCAGIATTTSNWMLEEAFTIAQWFYVGYLDGDKASTGSFKAIPREGDASVDKAEKKRLEKELQEREEELVLLFEQLEAAQAKAEAAEKTRQELEELLTASRQTADALHFNEAETRKRIIDIELMEAGWDVGADGQTTLEVGQEVEVSGQPTTTGIGYCDYVLFDDNGLPLGVVEAKKASADASQGKTQAKLYADALEEQYGQRPVIFYTNGFDIWIWDDAKGGVPRMLYGYYSKDSLRYCIQKTRESQALAELGPRPEIIDRMYQIEAVTRVTEKFETHNKRKALIVLATGTGKTRVAMALTELLSRAGWVQHVLFLCDRRELRKQAADAFAEFLPHEPRVFVSHSTKDDLNKRIYLATYPGMMKAFSNFDTGFFDLIIADESHRSIYNKYRDLFMYFDALQVGLTATPVDLISRNTYSMFECEDQDPTSYFSYEDAVNHRPPYLVPYKVIKHETKFLKRGVKYSEMTPRQKIELEQQVEEAEAVEYQKNQVDKSVFNEDTESKVLRLFMEKGIRNADGSTIGKTIIFAKNHPHAIYLRDLFYKLFPQYGAEFCEVIDNYEPRKDALIDSFKTENKLMVAISVDMLDTGIDIPEVVNLVFHKEVKSFVKFRQMIGRGTRLCKNLFGEGRDKREFYIFDHWGNFDYFGENPEEEESTASKSVFRKIFEERVELARTALAKQQADAFDLAIDLIEKDIRALPEDSISVKAKRREIETLLQPNALKRFDARTMQLLSNDMAQLMQWRKPQAKQAAYKMDLLMTRAAVERLNGSADYDDLRDTVVEWVSCLPVNLNQVREKINRIDRCKSGVFWMEATVQSLDEMRTSLRGIMHLVPNITDPHRPLVIDVTDDEEVVKGATKFADGGEAYQGDEMHAYRHRVEQVLNEIMDQCTALKKIRSGRPVSEEDIKELTEQVALRDPHLDLDRLLESSRADKLEEALYMIIGLSPEDVNERFSLFARQHPELTANQLRFLDMMKSYISNHGALRIEQLYHPPFSAMGTLDDLFPDNLKDELVTIVKEINQV